MNASTRLLAAAGLAALAAVVWLALRDAGPRGPRSGPATAPETRAARPAEALESPALLPGERLERAPAAAVGENPAAAVVHAQAAPPAWPTAPLHGSLVDAHDDSPLAGSAFRVMSWEPVGRTVTPAERPDWSHDWIESDADGRFAGAQPFPVGTLLLATPFNEQARVTLEPTGAPLEVRFEVGPRILLDFTPPGGRRPEDFIAGLYRSPEEAGIDVELHDPPSPWSPAKKEPFANAGAVRPGPPPWVRLAADAWSQPLPTFLILVSRDGQAKGAARVDDLERTRHQPLHVEVEELAVLTVVLRLPATPPPVNGIPHSNRIPQVSVALNDRTGKQIGLRWFVGGTSQFQGLRPGPYHLVVHAEPAYANELDVQVPAPGPVEIEIPDPGTEPLGALELDIQTDSGQPLDGRDGRANLTLVAVLSSVGRGLSPSWDGGHGHARVDALPPGVYRVVAHFSQGGFEVEPRGVQVTVPGPPAVMRVHDGMRQEWFDLAIRNPPAGGQVSVEAASPRSSILEIAAATKTAEPLEGGGEVCRLVLGPYPAGAFESLLLSADGRRTRAVALGEFPSVEQHVLVDVELEDGWSATFHVADEEGTPLPGVVLALDGAELHPSDANGDVQVEGEEKPARLTVATPGWGLAESTSARNWGSVFASGEFTVEEGHVDVFLRRR